MDSIWNPYGFHMEKCPGNTREMSGKHPGNVRETSAIFFLKKCPGNTREMSGKHPGNVRETSGKCRRSIPYGFHMEPILNPSRSTSLGGVRSP